MKYYCSNCGSEIKIVGGEDIGHYKLCMVCGFYGQELARVPDYETIERYEVRKKAKYPDNGLVFFRRSVITHRSELLWEEWEVMPYELAKTVAKRCQQADRVCEIVVADPPIFPQNDPCAMCDMRNDCFNKNTDKRNECQAFIKYKEKNYGGYVC